MLLPPEDVSNCIESSEKKVTFREGMSKFFLEFERFFSHLFPELMAETLKSTKMFTLAPFFLLNGIHTSFWVSVFPTTLTFNMHNSNLIYLPAIYGFGVGIGETISEFSFQFNKKLDSLFSGSSDLNTKQEDQGFRIKAYHGDWMYSNHCLLYLRLDFHAFWCHILPNA